jgi:hypothetical protein
MAPFLFSQQRNPSSDRLRNQCKVTASQRSIEGSDTPSGPPTKPGNSQELDKEQGCVEGVPKVKGGGSWTERERLAWDRKRKLDERLNQDERH